MITVTGLVFALTIVALQIAAGQYSPRLRRNFMRDRGTQVVLSVFVGTFAYSTAGCRPSGSRAPPGRRGPHPLLFSTNSCTASLQFSGLGSGAVTM
jgi:hypothetical protein